MKSRIPEITKKLPAMVAKEERDAAARIAQRASAMAPVQHGDLKQSLADPSNIRPVVSTIRGEPVVGWGIYAEWYWFLVEFGHAAGGPGPKGGVTGPAAPRPFLIPAAEAERAPFVSKVRQKLGNL